MSSTKIEAIRIVNEVLLPNINNPSKIINEIVSIWEYENIEKIETYSECIQILNNKHHINFLKLAIDTIKNGTNTWDIVLIIKDTISDLVIDIDSLLELLIILYKEMKGDLASGILHEPIGKLVSLQPDIGRSLLEKMILHNEEAYTDYISVILVTLSTQDFEKAHRYALDLAENPSKFISYAAINALGLFSYELPQHKEFLNQTLEKFKSLLSKEDINLQASVVHSLGRLIPLKTEIKDIIVKLADIQEQEVQYQISVTLFRWKKDSFREVWFKESLLKLAQISYQQKIVIDKLDLILADILKLEIDSKLVEQFLYNWIKNQPIEILRNNNIADYFDSTLRVIVKNKDVIEYYITMWFNDDDYKFHFVSASIVRYLKICEINCIKLSKTLIDQFDNEDILFIIRKILGHVFDSSLLCHLTFSVLQRSNKDEGLKQIVVNAFISHISRDYPKRVIDFLELQEISLIEDSFIKNTITIILDYTKKYLSALNELPRLKEFKSTNAQRYQIELEQQKNIMSTFEKAQENSIFFSITERITIKYGHSWFHWCDNKFSERNYLNSISTSVEVPRTELISPVSSAIKRFKCQLAKRGV